MNKLMVLLVLILLIAGGNALLPSDGKSYIKIYLKNEKKLKFKNYCLEFQILYFYNYCI